MELQASLGGPPASPTSLTEEVPGLSDDQDARDTSSTQDVQHWETRSAVVSEPELLALAGGIPVRCCGDEVLPSIKRVSISFSLTWVSLVSAYFALALPV